MPLSEYDFRQLLYFHYNDLKPFTIDDILRKAKMSLNRNTTKEEVEKLLDYFINKNIVSRNNTEMYLSSKLSRSKCSKCTFVFYVGDVTTCPNCGGTLRRLD